MNLRILFKPALLADVLWHGSLRRGGRVIARWRKKSWLPGLVDNQGGAPHCCRWVGMPAPPQASTEPPWLGGVGVPRDCSLQGFLTPGWVEVNGGESPDPPPGLPGHHPARRLGSTLVLLGGGGCPPPSWSPLTPAGTEAGYWLAGREFWLPTWPSLPPPWQGVLGYRITPPMVKSGLPVGLCWRVGVEPGLPVCLLEWGVLV